jgi:hypothetical protein
MNLDEVSPVIDVHPPHEPIHGWRDFFIHLSTITIGLLIALSLEGCVEWQHHRHLVHEAEASLHAEIQSNAKGMQDTLADLRKQQENLKQDVVVLKYIMKNHKSPENSGMEITFHIRTFDSVSWKTAQSTGALSYMPYELAAAEQQGARDAIVSLASFMNLSNDDPDPTEGQAEAIKQKIEVLQGQLILVNNLFESLDRHYKSFLGAHPD